MRTESLSELLKEFMELALNPLNYLTAISPRLEGNILHNKASSFKWIAIL